MGITRDDHVFVAVNQALCSLTDYEPRQLVGELVGELVPGNWRKVRDHDGEALHEVGALDVRREVLHRSGLRLRLRLLARRVPLASQWLTLWTVLDDEGEGRPTPMPDRALSPRELEVIAGLARGMRVREIAVRLGISPSTVTTHVRNATSKLQARSRTHLVGMALARELIDPNLSSRWGHEPHLRDNRLLMVRTATWMAGVAALLASVQLLAARLPTSSLAPAIAVAALGLTVALCGERASTATPSLICTSLLVLGAYTVSKAGNGDGTLLAYVLPVIWVGCFFERRQMVLIVCAGALADALALAAVGTGRDTGVEWIEVALCLSAVARCTDDRCRESPTSPCRTRSGGSGRPAYRPVQPTRPT